jgi:hypothetical protein
MPASAVLFFGKEDETIKKQFRVMADLFQKEAKTHCTFPLPFPYVI